MFPLIVVFYVGTPRSRSGFKAGPGNRQHTHDLVCGRIRRLRRRRQERYRRAGQQGKYGDLAHKRRGCFERRWLASVPVNWRVAQTGDYDGDGKSDLLWEDTASAGNVAIWFMNGVTVSSGASVGTLPSSGRWKRATGVAPPSPPIPFTDRAEAGVVARARAAIADAATHRSSFERTYNSSDS
jgi:hypothetical protein